MTSYVILAFALTIPQYVAAAIPVSTCGTTCFSDCELTDNIFCSGQDGVTLANGADLDMRGFDIDCDPFAGCGSAVLMTSPNSVVRSTNPLDPNDPRPRIGGTWLRGVNCQAQSGSRVTGITLRGLFYFGGVYKCETVDLNTIVGLVDEIDTSDPQYPAVGKFCIVHTPISNVDLIANNYLDGCTTGIARLNTGPMTTLTIDSNAINYRDYSPGGFPFNYAIDLLSTSNRPAIVKNNVITGDGRGAIVRTYPTGNPQVTYTNNVCRRGLERCAAAVSSGQCVAQGVVTSP